MTPTRPTHLDLYIRWSRNGAVAGLIALFVLCLAWEAWLAPVRAGSLLWLKAVPALFPLMGVLKGRRYTYQWLSMYVLAWFIEGVMRAWGDKGLPSFLASVEIALSVWVCFCCVVFARYTRPSLVMEQA
ncbi:MAG: DUF2069 domain-containing protein [Burkholderiales bacterium]|nr:DUF2069 domain-containing protein [Burkholderiales bacterium]